MKLKTAFKLSALAVALASTSAAFAVTQDTSELGNDAWTDPRAPHVGNVDTSAYQYVDVGSGSASSPQTSSLTANDLTSWYTVGTDNVIKIETVKNGVKSYTFYDASSLDQSLSGNTLQNLSSLVVVNGVETIAGISSVNGATGFTNGDDLSLDTYYKILTVPEQELLNQYTQDFINAVKNHYASTNTNTQNDLVGGLVPPNLGGVTGTKSITDKSTALVKRLDSQHLEYAETAKEITTVSNNFGNLTDNNTSNPQVWLTIDTPIKSETTNEYDRGVITGIIGATSSATGITNNRYGVVASETKTTTVREADASGNLVIQNITKTEKSTTLDQDGIVVTTDDGVSSKTTTVTANGITTGSLTVAGVDVGQALGNAAILGNLSTADITNLVNSGQTLTTLQGDVTTLQTDLSALDAKVDTEVERLDGRIDTELAANASASTAYTDKKVTDTTAELRSEAALESTRVDQAISAGDDATLIAANTYTNTAVSNVVNTANAYTDNQIAGVNTRVDQLNKRVDDVEQTSYRGIAIALAAQQQIPNIGAGQFAVFGGVGHYEGESAAALGLASVLADGRTAFSAALGVAGGSEVGGRVGVSYVFGGK